MTPAPIVLVPKPIAARIAALRMRHLPAETGGFLIGLRRLNHIEVTDLTEQQPGDRASPISFLRNGKGHAASITRSWRNSGKTLTVVGDWHSHPIGDATPSHLDQNAWRALAHALHRPVVGLIAGPQQMRLFRTEPTVGLDVELSRIQDDLSDLAFADSRCAESYYLRPAQLRCHAC